jgi:cyanophycinase-like exopeptidase
MLPSLTLAAACSVTVFPRYGRYVPAPHLHGPGLLLDGAGASGSPDSTLRWLHRRLAGDTPARAGNVVILRASYTNIDDRHFYRAGNFASVQTVLIPPCTSRRQFDAVAPIVDRADAVYFAGGDQANYVRWKASALSAAVTRVYARGGVVGGGSAGLAIQGAVVYDSVAADRLDDETTTSDAVADPLEARISFTTGLFAWPPLANTITDTHLVTRDRIGRTIAFLARIWHDGLLPGARAIYALGIDEGSAVVVDPDGSATLLAGTGHGAYLVRSDAPAPLAAGHPLRYTVEISHVARDGERFDLLRKTTPEPWHAITVDGSRAPVYDRNPYQP